MAGGTGGTPGTPRLLRALNDRTALDLLVSQGPLTRTRLGELTGLSKPTASQLLARLQLAGLVREAGTTDGARGPNAQLYAVDGSAGVAAGVDVEPHRATAALVDLAGVPLAQASVDLPHAASRRTPGADVRAALDAACALARVRTDAVDALVVAAQGSYDPRDDSLAYAWHMPGWSRPGLVAGITDALDLPVTVENDVNLAAVAEQTHGLPYPAPCLALLWMGDGLGLAVHLGGVPHRGATGGAGEIGYIPVPAVDGRPAGIELQDLIGGPAVLALARSYGLRARRPEVAVARAAGDLERGGEFLADLAARVATGLATIVAVLDPDLVVLSGPVGQAGGDRLPELVGQQLHRVSPLRTRIAASGVPGNPVLAGAVQLALDTCRDRVFERSRVPESSTRRSPLPRTDRSRP